VGGDDGDNDNQAQTSIEATGKTVDDAIDTALVDLGLERHEVSVEVLAEGRSGLFGIGGEPARVRVTAAGVSAPEGEEVSYASQVLEDLLRLTDVDAEVYVRAPETPGDGLGLTKAVLDVEGDDLGVLIGRRGATLASVQYLVNLIVSRRFKNVPPVAVDVGGYRRRREESLEALAFRMADRVRANGRTVVLEPMPPNERRIVHLALSKDPTVDTSSVGEGDMRKVAISVRR
jgi:spoIIIJ-associated protein